MTELDIARNSPWLKEYLARISDKRQKDLIRRDPKNPINWGSGTYRVADRGQQ